MKRMLSVMVLALLLVGAAAVPVSAGRDDGCVNVDSRSYFDEDIEPGRMRVRDSSLAIRGARYSSTVTGHPFLEGTSTAVFNLNLDLVTLTGVGWGSQDMVSANFEGSGFAGVYRMALSDFDLETGAGTYVGRLIGWGYGEFEGLVYTATGSQTIGDEYQTATGVICRS